jgi:hypothetical protein
VDDQHRHIHAAPDRPEVERPVAAAEKGSPIRGS